jgi:hypothetical protein
VRSIITALLLSLSSIGFSQTIGLNEGFTYSISRVFDTLSVSSPWDFSTITIDTIGIVKMFPKDSSVHASSYPGATHVKYDENNYEHFLGFFPTENKFFGGFDEITTNYQTPLTMITLPISIGGTHTDSVYTSFYYPNVGAIQREDKIEVEAITTGTITMPDGAVYNNALLFHVIRTFTDNPNPQNTFTTVLDMYQWTVPGIYVPIAESQKRYSNGSLVGKFSKFISGNPLIISEINNYPVSIYPNPANDVIVVTAPIGSSITVLNINGQVIKKQLTEGSETTLNVSDLSADVYLVQVQTAEGIATQKVIKK